MYQLRYEELHPQFGTSVRGIDLGNPLTPDLIQEINAEINRYSFVFFPDQSMDDDRQLALTRQFGIPEPSHTSVGKVEYFGTIGNVQKDGTVLGSSHKKTIFHRKQHVALRCFVQTGAGVPLDHVRLRNAGRGRHNDVRLPARRLRSPLT